MYCLKKRCLKSEASEEVSKTCCLSTSQQGVIPMVPKISCINVLKADLICQETHYNSSCLFQVLFNGKLC